MKLDRFSDTIEQIYAAASDPAGWDAALRAVEDLTGSVGAVIDFIPRTSATAPMTMAGRFTLEQCAQFAADYQGICRRIAYGTSHPEQPFHYDAMVLEEDEMDRDPVYAWLATHGLRYYIGTPLPGSERHQVYASLQRSPSQGHVQADDIRLFGLVSKHLGKAIALAERLGTLDGHRRFAQHHLDGLPHALFALDEKGRLIFANRAAECMLASGGGLVCLAGRLVASHAGDRATLARLIASAAHPDTLRGGGWMRLASGDDGPPLAAFVSHLALDQQPSSGTQPFVLVAVSDPCATRDLAPGVLSNIYGLTAAEARIASALAADDALGSAERRLGISPETFKSHLKSIFRKLDVHRRQDVVRIVTGLATLSGPPPNGG